MAGKTAKTLFLSLQFSICLYPRAAAPTSPMRSSVNAESAHTGLTGAGHFRLAKKIVQASAPPAGMQLSVSLAANIGLSEFVGDT
jgi:hypothetical protein